MMAASEKSEPAVTPQEQVENVAPEDQEQHHKILSAAEAAGQDAVHIKLSWRSWVSCRLPQCISGQGAND